jgi:hypothetical protein
MYIRHASLRGVQRIDVVRREKAGGIEDVCRLVVIKYLVCTSGAST